MSKVNDPNINVIDGIAQLEDGEYLCICPNCLTDITDDIDDLEAAFECPYCGIAVRFVEAREGRE